MQIAWTDRRTLIAVGATALAIRLGVLLWGYAVHHAEHPEWSFLEMWCRWDAVHYIAIAVKGYLPPDAPPEQISFYSGLSPLYPALLGLTSLWGKISPGLTGIILSVLAHCISSVLLFSLIRNEAGDVSAAWFGTLLFCIYPGSYYANVPYTESLFIMLLLLYFSFQVLEPSPVAQGIALGLAILTRTAGATLLPLHLVLFIRGGKHFGLRQITGLTIPFLAGLLLFWISQRRYGDPFFFVMAGKDIAYSFNAGWIPFEEALPQLRRLVTDASYWKNETALFTLGLSSLFLVCATLVIILDWRRLRWEYRLFAVPYLWLFAAAKWNMGNMRYIYPLFPLFIVLSRIRNRILQSLLCSGFLAMLLYFSARFTKGYWID